MKNYSDRLLQLEKDLNSLGYKGIPIGGLFSRLFLILDRKDNSRINDLNKFYVVPLIIWKSIRNKKNKIFSSERNILLGNLTKRVNFNLLVEPLKKEFSNNYVFYGPSEENDEFSFSYQNHPNLGLVECLKILSQTVKLFPKVYKLFKRNNISCGFFNVFNYLFVQLLRLESTHRFLTNFKLVIVDFDRSFPMAPLILAARARNIKTITLVHGALSSYGYTPLIADEIWCWGELQKQQLINQNVCPSTIKIVGNPAMLKINKPNAELIQISEQYFQKPLNFTLGVILTRNNIEYWEFIISLKRKLKQEGINFLVKKHPFIDLTEGINYEKELSVNLQFFNNRKHENYTFFNLCDLIISPGSSMTYEAIINETPVILIDFHKEISKLLLHNMSLNAEIPLFGNQDLAAEFIDSLIQNPEKLKQLMHRQKLYVMQNVYSNIGGEATREIIKFIKNPDEKTQPL